MISGMGRERPATGSASRTGGGPGIERQKGQDRQAKADVRQAKENAKAALAARDAAPPT